MKEKISITIDKKILEQIKKLAKQENRSLSNFIENILKER